MWMTEDSLLIAETKRGEILTLYIQHLTMDIYLILIFAMHGKLSLSFVKNSKSHLYPFCIAFLNVKRDWWFFWRNLEKGGKRGAIKVIIKGGGLESKRLLEENFNDFGYISLLFINLL